MKYTSLLFNNVKFAVYIFIVYTIPKLLLVLTGEKYREPWLSEKKMAIAPHTRKIIVKRVCMREIERKRERERERERCLESQSHALLVFPALVQGQCEYLLHYHKLS